jgi:ribosomal protein S18 acetylase RimI-like enzyme
MSTGGTSNGKSIHEDVEIREIELEDIAPVFALGERIYTAEDWPTLYRTWDENELVSLYAANRETCLVAKAEGRIAGFVLGTLLEKRRGTWVYGYVQWLGVDPYFVRHGIGTSLMEEIRERFINAGARMLLVDTEADNKPALRLFKKVGFDQKHPHVYLSMNLTHHPDYVRKRARRGRG